MVYHPSCITVGNPVRTRYYDKGTRELKYPPCANNLPFICELCTVRAHTARELDPYCDTNMIILMLEEISILILEQMRIINTAHAWGPSALQTACVTIRHIEQFYDLYHLSPL